MVTTIWALSAFGQVTEAAVPLAKEATKSVV